LEEYNPVAADTVKKNLIKIDRLKEIVKKEMSDREQRVLEGKQTNKEIIANWCKILLSYFTNGNKSLEPENYQEINETYASFPTKAGMEANIRDFIHFAENVEID